MFTATHYEKDVEFDTEDYLEVEKFTDVQTDDGWIHTSDIVIGSRLNIDGDELIVSNIITNGELIRIYV